MDIIQSGLEIFDKVIIAVSNNVNKKSFLPVDIRTKLIQESIKDFKNAEVAAYDGLTVNFAKKCGAKVLLRGLRSSADFDYETQLTQTNQTLNNNIKTVFLISKPEYCFISSSAVKEIYSFGGDVSGLVPEPVFKYLSSLKK